MKIIGMLLILNTVVLAAWWVCTDHPHKAWAISVGLVTIFVGVYFTVQDRAVEITIDKVGSIKAAAEQASVDAQVVGDLRRRIESQSATVDLVADSATKAHSLIEDLSEKSETAKAKINELETAASAIEDTVSKLQETADFTSLVAAAQNDDRTAFNRLVLWAHNRESPYWQHAADAIVRIRTDFGGPIERGYMNVPWPKDIDPKKLALAPLRQEYRGTMRIYKADIVQTAWRSDAIDKLDKMAFFVDILTDDDSLHATFLAGKYFVEAGMDPNLTWSPFTTKPLLDWWAAHKDNIRHSNCEN